MTPKRAQLADLADLGDEEGFISMEDRAIKPENKALTSGGLSYATTIRLFRKGTREKGLVMKLPRLFQVALLHVLRIFLRFFLRFFCACLRISCARNWDTGKHGTHQTPLQPRSRFCLTLLPGSSCSEDSCTLPW